MPSVSCPGHQRLFSLKAALPQIAVALLSCCFAHAAMAQAPAPKLNAATQFVNKFGLPGKSGADAARIAAAKGFDACKVVGGALPNVPAEELLIQCDRQRASPYACKQSLQVIMQMDWEDKTRPVPEMLEHIMAATVQKVTTVCL